jgi:hypothetical protein
MLFCCTKFTQTVMLSNIHIIKQSYYQTVIFSNSHIIKDWGSFDRNSVDQNCVLSVDRNFTNQLTEFLDAFQLIESFNNEFGQTPKF